jgi:hypothetical protein
VFSVGYKKATVGYCMAQFVTINFLVNCRSYFYIAFVCGNLKFSPMKYELELWPNNRLLTKGAIYLGTIWFVGIAMVVAATLCWDDYVTLESHWRGGMKPTGWPVPVRIIGIWLCALPPLMLLLAYFQMDRKNPALALNKEGVMMNQLGWKLAFFEWSEITALEEINKKDVFGVIVRLKSLKSAMEKPGQKFQQYLRKEYVIKKKPVMITNEYVKGDAGMFIAQLKKYYEQSRKIKSENN